MNIKLVLLGALALILPQLREEADDAIDPENQDLEAASDAALSVVADLIAKYANDGKISKEEKLAFIGDNREALEAGWNALGKFSIDKIEAAIAG